MTADNAHKWLGIETRADGRYVAACSCGWRSRPASTAGLAGAAVDEHQARVDAGDDAGD